MEVSGNRKRKRIVTTFTLTGGRIRASGADTAALTHGPHFARCERAVLTRVCWPLVCELSCRRHRNPSVDSDDLSFKYGEPPRPDSGMRRTSLCLSIWMNNSLSSRLCEVLSSVLISFSNSSLKTNRFWCHRFLCWLYSVSFVAFTLCLARLMKCQLVPHV